MIKVLIVDDSALVRQLLTSILGAAKDIEVVGSAADPYIARDKIKRFNPDVLTLDIEMPRMDGLTFLGNLMRLRPMPVVMISSLTEQGADTTLPALELGAVDFIAKPKLDISAGLRDYAEQIVAKIRLAARARVQPLSALPRPVAERYSADMVLPGTAPRRPFKTTDKVIGIGASTGGTEAIKELISILPVDMPAVVISQHIPAAFSSPFARRLDGASAMTVREAKDGQQLLAGSVYIAPGDRHLLIERDGAHYRCRLSDGVPVNRHRPSVDVMFRSLALNAGPNALGVMLTGMGADGAEGMGEMHRAGAHTIAQDEKSSVVWGMPGEAVKRGYVDDVLALGKIAGRLIELVWKYAAG